MAKAKKKSASTKQTPGGKELRDRVVAFRLTTAELETFEEKLAASEMSKSAFFREVFINANVNLTIKAAPSKDHSALLFLYNKSSNNLNQLAHQVNVAHLAGTVTKEKYVKYINTLVEIRNLLLVGVQHVD